jgi:dTDP-4-amino-4,6-dideoxygalactose transaminase
MNPYKVVKEFEFQLSEYTGAPYVVCVDSSTNALFLCCYRLEVDVVTIPKHTYLSVPMSIIHSGGKVEFEDLEWSGIYQLKPYPIWDSAKRMKKDMYINGSYMTLSFHMTKHIPIGKGGAILCDNKEDYEWFKKARYEGRSEVPYHEDDIEFIGWNMYMTPQEAIRGLELLKNLPGDNKDLIEDPPYRDLTTFKVFKK